MTAEVPTGQEQEPPVVSVSDLAVWFPRRSGPLLRRTGWNKAVEGVSFSIQRGRTLALVGESGSGKSTTGLSIVRIQKPTRGSISLLGRDISNLEGRELRRIRRHMQLIFQDPTGSLNPRRTVTQVLDEVLRACGLRGEAVAARRAQLLAQVGLDSHHWSKYPHELSGGQRQRVGIARALATSPELVVCDEPVSSLDVSIQAQIMQLLARLQSELGVAYLFVSHDLAVVQALAHEVAVMHRGRLVEIGSVDEVFERPSHPYTAALLAAVPRGNPDLSRSERIVLRSEASSAEPATGCPFRTRCWAYLALDRPDDCEQVAPPAVVQPAAHEPSSAACHHAAEVTVMAVDELAPLRSDPPVRK